MTTSETERLCLAREILFSLLAGTSITLLLAVLRAAQILPEVDNVLLRPGLYLARKVRASGAGRIVLSVLGDGVVYSFSALLVMLLRSWHRPPHDREPQVEKRRAHRMPLTKPVFVYGRLRDEPFWENTETLNVSANGGLMPLSERIVTPSQTLVLTNPRTNEHLLCRVARLAETENGKTMIGFEFLQGSANFWQVNFVPSSRILRWVPFLKLDCRTSTSYGLRFSTRWPCRQFAHSRSILQLLLIEHRVVTNREPRLESKDKQ